ncbi:fluoride efflux transporter CrcB [Thiobacter aerophilum]|uniref:Fluoride-specific ion channel FluC n=1 Tax=Thiobacter aerophilum TaxID=3121275 RepID=A0ABV0EDD2_9BURK
MNIYALLAVAAGAVLGAWLRWGLAIWLNPFFPTLPLGTLAVNLMGGYLVGLAVAFFGHHAGLAPEWRLFVVTGFLGALTTFSTFSAEVVTLLLREQFAWAVAAATVHLLGSLGLTVLGIWTFKLIRG